MVMKETKLRQPTQKRAIEKKQKMTFVVIYCDTYHCYSMMDKIFSIRFGIWKSKSFYREMRYN